MPRKLTFLTRVLCLAFFAAVAKCQTSEPPFEDHSCTAQGGGGYTWPHAADGRDLNSGGRFFYAGGGFEAKAPEKTGRGWSIFLTANFLVDQLGVTANAINAAHSNPALSAANGGHARFYSTTFDPTFRFNATRRVSLYFSGGYGWLRRTVDFTESSTEPPPVTQPTGALVGSPSHNSGVLDVGAGVNESVRRLGGLMLFEEMRVWRGLGINGGTTLLAVTGGIRW